MNYPKYEDKSTEVPNRAETPVNSADALAHMPLSEPTTLPPGWGLNAVDQTLYVRHQTAFHRQLVIEHYRVALRRQYRLAYLLGALLIALVLMSAVAPTPPSWALIGIGAVASSLLHVGRECLQLWRERGRAKRQYR